MIRTLAMSSLLIACAGGPGPDGEPLLTASMEIGIGAIASEGFTLVEDGSDVALSSGAQGGFHVWTAPRFRGAKGTMYLDREARRVDDEVLVLRASRLVLELPDDAIEDWWHEEQAFPSFMCPSPLGIQNYDLEIEFSFELRSEEDELLARDSLILVPRCPTDEEGAFCREICGG